MAVHVDDAQIEAKVRNGRIVHDDRWSHLVATTPRELHDFATRTLGLKRSYFQNHWPYPHYDLTSGKRAQALANGAAPIEYGDPDALKLGRWLSPVLVTSSRDGVELGDVEAGLKPHFDPRKVLISGGARGGDRLSESVWQLWGGELDRHSVSPEAWNRSRQAGYDRNEVMVNKAARRGGECVALVAPCTDTRCRRQEPHGTHGASHCAGLAHAAGLQVDAPPIGGHPSAWQLKAEPAKHHWQPTDDRDRKECQCGVSAVRTRDRSSSGWNVAFVVPGLPPTPELPPHFSMGDVTRARPPAPTRQPQAAPDRPAEPPAAQNGRVQGTTYWFGVRYQLVACTGCGDTLRRAEGETYATCLKCETAEKVAGAGPEVAEQAARIQQRNADIGTAPQPEPAPEPEVAKQQPQADREAGL
jgi:Protein of unknown function (DUF4031)